jgi:hypothetical protein
MTGNYGRAGVPRYIVLVVTLPTRAADDAVAKGGLDQHRVLCQRDTARVRSRVHCVCKKDTEEPVAPAKSTGRLYC